MKSPNKYKFGDQENEECMFFYIFNSNTNYSNKKNATISNIDGKKKQHKIEARRYLVCAIKK
jgi:hypothetical protein